MHTIKWYLGYDDMGNIIKPKENGAHSHEINEDDFVMVSPDHPPQISKVHNQLHLETDHTKSESTNEGQNDVIISLDTTINEDNSGCESDSDTKSSKEDELGDSRGGSGSADAANVSGETELQDHELTDSFDIDIFRAALQREADDIYRLVSRTVQETIDNINNCPFMRNTPCSIL